jgi:epoxyqueuosine reductase
MDRRDQTIAVKRFAQQLGFAYVGISKAEHLEEEAPRLEAWLKAGRHGRMGYMENWFDKRLDPRKLVPGARSVLTLLYNHHNPAKPEDPAAPRISQYAYGEDYHHVIKHKLRGLVERIQTDIGDVEGRVFVDSAPVLERAWARRSGTGWVGKNGMLIHPRAGSYFFLAEFISDLDLEPDGPMKDYCGTCTACMDACPTDAIPEPYRVDGSRCISYLTIELKDATLPEAFRGRMENWAFGCDICQEVCPWNRFAQKHQEPAFEPKAGLLERSVEEWEELTESVFKQWFKGSSPVKRTKYSGLRRNLDFLGLKAKARNEAEQGEQKKPGASEAKDTEADG